MLKLEPCHLTEIKKCMIDPIYFINEYIIINTSDMMNKKTSFTLYDFQENFINTIHNNRFTIAKFSLDCGKNNTLASYLLWKLIFNSNHTIGLMNHKLKDAINTLSVIKGMFDNLPDWIKMNLNIIESKQKIFILDNGSRILCSPSHADGVIGMTINTLYIDGLAHMDQSIGDDICASLFPVITSSKTGTIVLIDTVKNTSNSFYRIWIDAINKLSSFIPIHIPWNVIPHRNSYWKDEMISSIGIKQFNDDYDVEFDLTRFK